MKRVGRVLAILDASQFSPKKVSAYLMYATTFDTTALPTTCPIECQYTEIYLTSVLSSLKSRSMNESSLTASIERPEIIVDCSVNERATETFDMFEEFHTSCVILNALESTMRK